MSTDAETPEPAKPVDLPPRVHPSTWELLRDMQATLDQSAKDLADIKREFLTEPVKPVEPAAEGHAVDEGGVMLTSEEHACVAECKAKDSSWPNYCINKPEREAERDRRALLAIINRLTSQRAVLDEAERLLRERKASTVRWTKTTVSIDWEDDYRTLADAYEALEEGE